MTNTVDEASVSADASVYTEPKYMVTIVTGASGDREDESAYKKVSPSATGAETYGYGYFQALNATTAVWTYKTVADNKGPKGYKDSLTIVQHGRGH